MGPSSLPSSDYHWDSESKVHGKSEPQGLLRWSIQYGACVIAKRDTLQMLLENLDAKGFTLTEVEIKEITGSEPLMVCDNVSKRI